MQIEQIQLPVTYEIDDSFLSRKFLKVRLKICHDGVNPKGTSFDVSGMEAASSSLYNTPILAHVLFDENGAPVFGGHDFHIETDAEDEEKKVVLYDEQPIGVVPESCNYAAVEENGHIFVCADGYVWRDYSGYAERIIERDATVNLSMEIRVNAGAYSKKDRVYRITDYEYRGITLLGDDHRPGIDGAQCSVVAFSKDQFLEDIEQLKKEIQQYSLCKEEQHLESPTVVEAVAETVPAPDSAKDNYELSSNLRKFLVSAVEDLGKYRPRWSDTEYPRYCVEDFDEAASMVYLYDCVDEMLCGASYTVNSDAVTIDAGTIHGVKHAYVALADGEAPAALPIPAVYTEAIDKLQDAYDAYVADHSHTNQEYDALYEYRSAREDNDRKGRYDAVIAEFDDLASVEDFIELKTTMYDLASEEDLREKCYAIRGRNIKFSMAPKKPNARIPVEEHVVENEPYGDLFARFNKNKN